MEQALPNASPAVGPDSTSVAGFLEWDHDRLDGLLDDTRRLLGSGRPEDAAARFTEFRDGLQRHIRMEEEVLFPAFELATGMSHGGPTGQMRLERPIQPRKQRREAARLDASRAVPMLVLSVRASVGLTVPGKATYALGLPLSAPAGLWGRPEPDATRWARLPAAKRDSP